MLTSFIQKIEKNDFFRIQFEEVSKLSVEEIKKRYKKTTEAFLKDSENKFAFVRFIAFESFKVNVLDERGGTILVSVDLEDLKIVKMRNNGLGILEGEVKVLDEPNEPTKVKVNLAIDTLKKLAEDGLVVVVDYKDE